MTAVLLTPLFESMLDANGDPLSGGLIYSYLAGTTTPQATYTDASGITPASNPIVLNSSGRPMGGVWGSGNYKFILKDSLGNTIDTVDNVSAIYGSGDMTKAVYDPANIAQQLVGTTAVQTITNKTLAYSSNTFTGMKPTLQRVATMFGSVATGATVIPADNTIPQITEGNEYMTQAITPLSATNILEVDVTIVLSNSASPNYQMIAALFRDAGANALAVVATQAVVATGILTLNFKYVGTAGSTSATTFRVRAGASVAGTTTFNGQSGAGVFGGVTASSISIKEYPA